jgi:hypothetical protein
VGAANAPDSAPVLPIVDLVRREVARIGGTLRDIAAQKGVTYGTLRRYHDPSLRLEGIPRKRTMEELSRALDVPLDQVHAAFVASVLGPPSGLDTGSVGGTAQDADEEVLFRLPPGLSPRQRETAIRLGRQSVQTYLDSLGEE